MGKEHESASNKALGKPSHKDGKQKTEQLDRMNGHYEYYPIEQAF